MNAEVNEVKLVADSGSTKTDWRVVGKGVVISRCSTQGINPFHQSEEEISGIINGELLPALLAGMADFCTLPVHVFFYGAGCRGDGADLLRKVLQAAFANAVSVTVHSDLMAAAHAVCGNNQGIACILGTGSNSCLYDGNDIVDNVSPLGYILGDEGSGAVLGRLFLNKLFKGNMPEEIKNGFLAWSGQTLDDIIHRVYRETMANRYLASLSPFIHSHIECSQVHKLVVDNFIDFFRKNVDHYNRHDLPVGAVGSVAYYYKAQLLEAAHLCGYEINSIIKSPIDGLCN